MKKLPILCSALLVALAIPASAATYTFGCITPNAPAECAAAGNFQVDVSDYLGDQSKALFTIKNNGPLSSSIAGIYFDDGSLLGLSAIVDSPAAVDFQPLGNPNDLPGGNNVNFNTSTGFYATALNPAPQKGVNVGEQVGIVFTLIGGQTVADTIAAMNLSLLSPGQDVAGGLRVGLHVISIDGGSSASFVNTPEPGFYGALALGLSGLYMAVRRRRSS